MNSLMFVFCLLCAIARAICLGVVDEDSFLVRGASKEALLLGKELISRGLLDEGTRKAKDSLKLYPRNDEAASILLELGLGLRAEGQESLALDLFVFTAVASKNESLEAVFQAGLSSVLMGRVELGGEWYRQVLKKNPRHASARINLAALHHSYGSIEKALENYFLGLEGMGENLYRWYHRTPRKSIHKSEVMLRSNIGAAYIQLGMFEEANNHTSNLIYDLLKVSEACFDNTIERPLVDTLGGGRLGDVAHDAILERIERHEEIQSLGNENNYAFASEVTNCKRIYLDISFAATHLLHIRKATCLWLRREELEHFLLKTTLGFISKRNMSDDMKAIVLLPFDTLLLPLATMQQRLDIASAYSTGPNSPIGAHIAQEPGLTSPSSVHTQPLPIRPLRLGLISYDFNDHPTSHLVEALFDLVNATTKTGSQRFHVQLFVYSYGKDDNSTYRHRIKDLASNFEDVQLLAYEEIAALIRRQGVDILYDMQVHTLGNRLKALSFRPAPVQVNYLVYPGTSGTTFLDYLVADRVVVPPEHSPYYSESLLMLPPSYQISYYTRHSSAVLSEQFDQIGAGSRIRYSPTNLMKVKSALRKKASLPYSDPELIVFCNFNKIDKFDRLTFEVWLSVMRRVPNSILWLLEPGHRKDSDTDQASQQTLLTIQHIRAAAACGGVDSSRIYFASRTNKSSHLERQLAADLFLDTFTYGAHSTATDALRAAVPVLTVAGGTFASRVGTSLYESLCNFNVDGGGDGCLYHTLIKDSVAAFEESAVTFAKQPALLHALQHRLATQAKQGEAIFDYQKPSEDFLLGAMALIDVQNVRERKLPHSKGSSRRPHVIIGK